MQQFTYIICKQYGVEYTLVLAIIEIKRSAAGERKN